jgi:hypothetical protein
MCRKIPIFDGESGSICASVRAIRGAVRNICKKVICDCNPCICIGIKKGKIWFCIHLRAPVGSNVQGISLKIQELVFEDLRNQFGLQTINCVNVVIEGFYGVEKKDLSTPYPCVEEDLQCSKWNPLPQQYDAIDEISCPCDEQSCKKDLLQKKENSSP